MKTNKIFILIISAVFFSGCTQMNYFGGPGSGDVIPDGPGSGDEMPAEPEGPGSGDTVDNIEPSGPGSGDTVPNEPTGPGSGDTVENTEPSGPGSGDTVENTEPTGPGSGDTVENTEPTGPGSGDELPYEPEPTGPGSGDEVDPNEPTSPGSGDEVDPNEPTGPGSGDEVPNEDESSGPGSGDEVTIQASCDAIAKGSTCIEYIGSFWSILQNTTLNCTGAGIHSTNPCPRPTVGGCNVSPGTANEIVIWHYDHGGDPFTPDVVPYAATVCNVNPMGTWVAAN